MMAAVPVTASPSLLRREHEKDETRRRILQAARARFTREGYASTTMRGIADSIGYTATAIYHHFADKHALMLELCANDFHALGRALTSIGSVADPVDRIRQMGRGYVAFALAHPEQFRFMFLIDPSPEDVGHLDPGQDGYQFLKQAVTEAIEGRRFRPAFNDPEMVAQMLWGGVHGLATIHVTSPEGGHPWLPLRDPLITAGALCDAMLTGLLRKP